MIGDLADATLASGVATSYGFLVTEHGVGVATFNLGTAGEKSRKDEIARNAC